MKNRITYQEFIERDSHSKATYFIRNSTFEDFENLIQDYFGEEYDIPIEEFDFKEILEKYKENLKFKLNVVFTKEELKSKIMLSFDSYDIRIIKTNLMTNKKCKFKYNIESKRINPKLDLIKKRLYNLILEILSTTVSLNIQEGEFYEGNDSIAFSKAIKSLINHSDWKLIKTEEEWIKLSDNAKKKLFIKSIILHIQINTAILSTVSRYLDNSFHFGPVRETPKYLYSTKNKKFSNEEYYSLLNSIPTQNDVSSSYEWRKAVRFLEENELANAIFTTISKDLGKLQFIQKNGVKLDLADAPSGLIQLFPILLKTTFMDTLFKEFKRVRFSIEQPELHLHPKIQSKLAEFLVKNGNLLIETHSEHIIKKLQIMFAKGEITDDDVNINYFENKNSKTKVKKMKMDKNGFFIEPWPDGFFDEGINLTEELLFAPKK